MNRKSRVEPRTKTRGRLRILTYVFLDYGWVGKPAAINAS